MLDTYDEIAKLSPKKRALLEKLMIEEGVDTSQLPIAARRSNEAPLLPVQKRFWLLEKIHPNSPAYNIPLLLKFKGKLHIDLLEKSFNEIVNRHEILRTIFIDIDGEPIQRIIQKVNFKIQVIELDKDSLSNTDEEVQNLLNHEIQRPFNFNKDSLLRVLLLKNKNDEYLLSILTHHLVADGWSIRVLLKEISKFYDAFLSKRDHQLAVLPIQYGDYAFWIIDHLHDSKINKQLVYWKNKLKNATLVLDLPTDFPRPPVEEYHGGTYHFKIDKAHTQLLSKITKGLGVTRFILLLALFKVLLYKYTRQTDLIVATATSNRNRNEIENLVGNFSNNILIHTNISDNPDVRSFVMRIRDTFLEALKHQDVPFEVLVDKMNIKRDLSRNALFQAMFVLHQGKHDELITLPDVDVSEFYVQTGASKFDLYLEVYDGNKEIQGAIEYNKDIFTEETIERLANHLLRVIEATAEDSSISINKIDMLTESEKNSILYEWNKTKADFPYKKCVHQLVEEQANKTPDKIAAQYENKELTYKELNSKANSLANFLLQKGIQQGSLVGFCVERSIDMLPGLLGILKAGAAYVPMDPSFPPDRLNYMLKDAGIDFLITEKHLVKLFPDYRKKIYCLDEGLFDSNKEIENPELIVSPENLAYVIYTSGSTGNPKGVQIQHKSVVNFLHSMQNKPGISSSDVLVSVTTISFDISILELFLPLISGAKVVIASKAIALEGSLLIKLLEESEATLMQATPSTWHLMIEAGWNTFPDLNMLCGGESLPRDLANKMLDRGRTLWNMYGPTETTIWSSVKKIDPGNGPVLIGPPIANTQFYILDKEMKPVPVGVSGELLIGGDGLAKGYLNRSELTKERFVRNPFTNSGTYLYRTGDLARFCSSGDIEFLGRLDFQVKVRGFRIELGEIEKILSVHPKIKEVIVVAWDDENSDKRLVAYIIPSIDQEVKMSDLREYIEKKLPEYMIPSLFVMMDKFPLTPNAKIDRKALPEPDTTKLESESRYIAPRDELELQLEVIWQKALGVKNIGINDNFFELGGHSLLAAKLFAQIEKKLGKNLPLATLFLAPTIGQIADILRQKEWKPTWTSIMPIQTKGTKTPLFLIHAADGNVLLYKDLSYYLGEDQPVYGLQSQGLDGSEPMQTQFESMAENYIKEIKSVQPEGPYNLGGYCLGGTIALEIAQQLKQQGDEIALLAMLETYNIQEIPTTLPSYYKLLHKIQNLKFHLDNLLLSKSKDRYKFFKKKATVEWSRFKIKINITFSTLSKKLNLNNSLNYHHLLIDKVNDRAQFAYKPKAYNGKITLFRPEINFAGLNDTYFGWGKYALKGVEILSMPVKPRGSLTEPFVRLLAEKLHKELENANPETNTKSIDLN